jgi:hypothetical protein
MSWRSPTASRSPAMSTGALASESLRRGWLDRFNEFGALQNWRTHRHHQRDDEAAAGDSFRVSRSSTLQGRVDGVGIRCAVTCTAHQCR